MIINHIERINELIFLKVQIIKDINLESIIMQTST